MDIDQEQLLWFGVTSAIIAGMIWFADIGKFTEAILAADPLPLIPAFFFGLLVLPCFGFIWYRFFQHMKIPVSYFKSLKMFLAGNFLNGVTPLGQFGGEPLMAYVISRNTDASYEKGLSTVISADIINTMPLFTFTVGGTAYLLLFRTVSQVIIQTLFMAIIVGVLGGAFVYIMWFEAGKIESVIFAVMEKLVNLIGRGEHLLEKLESSLEEVQKSFHRIGESPRHLIKVAMIAHLTFFLNILSLYFILIALGHKTDLSLLYFVSVIAGFGNFSPTPGGGGTVEAVMAGTITVFTSIPFATAVVSAIIFRLTTHWPGLLLGWLSLNTLKNGRD